MMKNDDNSSTCERADDLVSVLYGEATEQEQREFQLHLKQCENCRAEFGAFAQVREAIGEWRHEALNGFVSSPIVAAPLKKSAVAALRQFLALSPLWMKGAVGFAAVVFCVLVALALGRWSSSNREPVPVAQVNPAAIYTKDDVERAVGAAVAKQQALAQKEREQRVLAQSRPQVDLAAKSPGVVRATHEPQARRPFSRAEREQLAAELRLFSSDDNDPELPDR
jgi:hypothetical protein